MRKKYCAKIYTKDGHGSIDIRTLFHEDYTYNEAKVWFYNKIATFSWYVIKEVTPDGDIEIETIRNEK